MLLTPGPTAVPEFIRKSMANETIHHRTKEFENLFKNTRELLKKLLNMQEVVVFATTGTGAMEAAVLNFCKKKAVVINSGKFGERFSKICQAHNKPFVELKQQWHTPVCLEDIKDSLNQHKDIDTIFLQICESSGGLRHPVESITKLVKSINKDIIIVADGITAVGVEHINTTNIDVLIAGSQKALMLPPGLSIVGLSSQAINSLQSFSAGYYLNLKVELDKQKQNTTAYTAPTTLIIGLQKVLQTMDDIGFDKIYKDTKKRAAATRKSLEALGMKIYPKAPSDAMTTIYHEQSTLIRDMLKNSFDINIAGGQDHLKGKIFRINHMGFVKNYEAFWVVNAIELCLDKLGLRQFDSAANQIMAKEML